MRFNRRSLLRGMFHGSAATMALPILDCFLDGNGQAFADTGKKIPVRFGTFFWGCGLTKTLYLPKNDSGPYNAQVDGTYANYIKRLQAYEDTQQLASLKPFKAKFNLYSGLRAMTDAKPNYQHWTGVASINTGIAPATDQQFDGQTIDVTIADKIGKGVRFKSIEVACSGNKRESVSSLGGSSINPPETSPLELYTRLFGPGFQDPSKGNWQPDPQVMLQQSVLSVVADDRKALMESVGAADKARMDQYFTSVRELEGQMQAELQRPEIIAQVSIPQPPENMPASKSVPVLKRTVPMFAKLAAIGMATDQTRVLNFSFSEPASTIYMPGDTHPFHQATHEEPVDEKLGYQPVTSKFSTYSMEGFAQLLAELDGIKEGDGTLLDHAAIMAFTDTSYAKIHAVDGIPIIVAGSAGGKMRTGMHIAGDGGPVSRVGLTLQQAFGIPLDHWGAGAMQTDKSFTEVLI